MTEQEWLEATDPQPMLEFLREKASDRKLRLYVVACCRRIYHPERDEQTREAVEIGEQFADGLVSDSIRHDILEKLRGMKEQAIGEESYHRVAWLMDIQSLVYEDMIGGTRRDIGAWYKREITNDEITHEPAWLPYRATWRLRRGGCKFLRDVFGPLPFRPVPVDLAWLTWHEGTIPRMAQVIYEERAFDRLPILADALEDAGCDNADILDHCRQPGVHVRGCWVVDLLLGKS